MLLERVSALKLSDIEPLLRRAAWRRRASISAVQPAGGAMVFTILQPELYARLLAAEIRFAAFLPCLIAAFEQETHQNVAEFVRRWMKRPGVPEDFRARYETSTGASASNPKEATP